MIRDSRYKSHEYQSHPQKKYFKKKHVPSCFLGPISHPTVAIPQEGKDIVPAYTFRWGA